MAGNTIDINLSVQDQNRTLQARTNDARRLNEQLERAQNLSRGTGTRTGNQAMRQAGFGGEVSEYNIAGGASQRAGGTARDFADQARGLGGLVRLYAEYAANLFAVTAAFTALRNAMDTQIMIRGMEQLSAATGDSLASMAKSFASATDGMISFREAAEAVTKATTSGMGREQVMQIAEVAKGASQALGVNMTDAVSRLTRGITKLEPELLDELGIFTKLDKAVQDYARTVGKSESQLTDFERRQAFANAVLKEGRDKFSEIAQEGNPYDKLLASLKDTGTQILNIINSIVAPIAKIFADNQVLIGGAIAIITSRLLTKAIPALNDYGEWLKKTAKESAEVARGMSSDAWHGQYTRLADKAGMSASQKRVMDLASENLSLEKQIDDTKKKQANTIQEIIKRDNQVTVIQAKILANQREITAERKKQDTIAQNTIDRMEQEPTLLKDTWGFMKAKIADMENSRARGLDIRSQVVDVAQDQGPIAALEKLNELLAASSGAMGFFARAGTRVAGVIAIIGVAIRTAISFLAPYIKALGVIIAIYEVLAPYIHNNTKETEAFNNKLDQLTDSTKTATDVNEKYKQSLSTDAVLAYANSFDSVTKSMKDTMEAFKEARAAANPFDKILDTLKDITPFLDSLQEKAAAGLAGAVQAQIKTLGDRPETEKYKQDIGNVLGIDPKKPINEKSVKNALDSISVSAEEFADRQEKIVAITEKANKKFQEQTLYLKGLKEESRNAEKAAANFMNSLKDTSQITQFQENNLKYLVQLNKALESSDFRSQIAALDSLKDANFGALFGSAAVEVANLSDQFEEMQPGIDAASKELEKTKKRLDELGDGPLFFRQAQEKEGLELLKKGLEEVINSGKEKAVQLGVAIAEAVSKATAEQADSMFKKYKLEFQKLGVEQAKFIASKSPVKTIEGIEYQAELDKKLLDVDSELVNSNYDLAKSIDSLNMTIQAERDSRTLEQLKSKQQAFESGRGSALTNGEQTQISRLESSSNPELLARAQLLLMQTAKELGITQQAYEAEVTKYTQIFPALAGQLNRNLTASLKRQANAYKKEQVNVTAEIEKINLSTQRTVESLDNQIQSINTALTNIGNDTPERIQIQMNAAERIYKLETAKIEALTQAKLDNLAKLEKSSQPPPTTVLAAEKKRIADEKAMALLKLEQNKQERDLQNETQKTYLEEKRKLDATIAITEAQKGLIVGEGILAEKLRQTKDIVLEKAKFAQDELELTNKLNISRANLAKFDKQYEGMEFLTPQQTTDREALAAQVEADKNALDNKRNINRIVGEGNALQRAQNLLVMEQALNQATLEYTLARESAANDKIFDQRQTVLDQSEQELGIKEKLGLIIDRELQVARADSAIKKVNLEFERESFRLSQEKLRIEQQLKDAQKRAGISQEMDEFGNFTYTQNETPEIINLRGQLKSTDEAIDRTKTKATDSIRSITRDLEITPRMEKYSQAFQGFFDGMADSIANWAMTGKWNSKDLINSLINDLLRYELRLQTHALYVQTIRPLIGNLGGWLSMTFGPGTATGGNAFNAYVNAGGFAKGGAFDTMGSIPGYAKGGMFTNSIVNSPTLFKAAKGLGVMGEAGPEAIMPLKRDSQGNLGVRGGSQGNVEVVVNNYSSEKAETKETTDSRGNRRIEVQIGDIVAGQMSTPNSSVQQAMTNGFSTRPRMVRR
jgi:phage-related minor tail protein